MKAIFSVLFLLFAGALSAQTTVGLVTYYSLNNCRATDDSGNANEGQFIGDTTCVCGVDGQALFLDGNDEIFVIGAVDNYFETDDFSLAMFFNPVGTQGTQVLVSRGAICDGNNYFTVQYTPSSRKITVELSENSSKFSRISGDVDPGRCWQHFTVVRNGGTTRLYINGKFVGDDVQASRIDLTSDNGTLRLAAGPCVGLLDNRFEGIIDEFRLYNRALDNDEVAGLYDPLVPNLILTRDTTVFLGNEVEIDVHARCIDELIWTPNDDLVDPDFNIFAPTQTRTYNLAFVDNDVGCIAQDSVRIVVIDPDNLDCSTVFLPSAFTPNGDGLNDTYGISNPYAVVDLISFEIFDRWGERVFMTDNAFEQWDGSFQNDPLNPGVLLYKIRYRCQGEERSAVGSLSIVR